MARTTKKANYSLTEAYNKFKEFEGQRYMGMKIGRSHHWNYDKGDWKETKKTPDLWEIQFNVKKRRKGKAPEGSGVPVGTEYHWYILAHQTVKKVDANTYDTELIGMKYKVAHKRAGKDTWSASTIQQRKRIIAFLESTLHDLKEEDKKIVPLRKKPKKPLKKAA